MTSAGGEVVSALAMAQQALAVHFMLEHRPGEVEDHPLLEDVLGLAAIGYTVVRRLAPELVPLTDAIIDGWPMAWQDIDPYSVRPAREMMAFAGRQVSCAEALAALPTPTLPRPIAPREAKELAWPMSTAPGYSVAKARDDLVGRYAFPWRTARPSLERIFADIRGRALVLEMRADGLRDWQILTAFCGVIIKAQALAGRRLPMDRFMAAFQARSQRAERKDDVVVDPAIFTREALEGQVAARAGTSRRRRTSGHSAGTTAASTADPRPRSR